MSPPPQTKTNTASRPIKMHKRLRDNGADESCFIHTFGKQQKTVFTSPPPLTDTPAPDQQTGSSHRCFDPQDLAQPSGLPVAQQLSQAAHMNQHLRQAVATYPVSDYTHAQSGGAVSMPNVPMGTGEATSPVYPLFPSLDNQYAGDPMFAPYDTESHFDPGDFYVTMHPQGLPARSQWDQTPLHVGHMGRMGYSQNTVAQQGVTAASQSPGQYFPYMQQNIDNRSSSQFLPTYGSFHHVDSSAPGRHLPPSSSTSGGPGPNGTRH